VKAVTAPPTPSPVLRPDTAAVSAELADVAMDLRGLLDYVGRAATSARFVDEAGGGDGGLAHEVERRAPEPAPRAERVGGVGRGAGPGCRKEER